MFHRAKILIAALLLSLATPIFADSSFVVHHIQIQGLQRVSSSAVMSSIPLRVGQTYTSEEGNAIIATLFKTEFFSNVQLSRKDDTLVVTVVERPTIDSVQITGNKSIKISELKPILKKLGIVVGFTFDPSELHAIVLGLQQQYALLGHAGAIVNPTITTMSRNRVAIHIQITEGVTSIVHDIQIVGNHAYSEKELQDQFKLTTPSIFTWFNHNDRYSNMRLDNDLQNLQNFYYNHGYLDFQVVSHHVTHLAKGGVLIHVRVSEGAVYHISGYQLTAVQLPPTIAPKVHDLLATLVKGSVFSRQEILDLNKKLSHALADHGYAFPVINPIPTIDHVNHTVFINYTITSGHRVYVRHINIVGDTRTNGLVVRTQLRQMEGSLYSLKNVEESKRNINMLGYLNHVEVVSKPVPNKNNQMDLDYHVHEVNAGRASVQAGYSDVEGFLYGASVSEPNFLGSGKYMSVGFQRSQFSSNYGITYNNPFYTASGISHGYNLNYSHTTPNNNLNLVPYTMDDYGVSTNWGIPLSEFDQFTVGTGYDYIAISNVVPSQVSPSVTSFLAMNPSPYNQLKVFSGISHTTLDRAIFPTRGNEQGLSLTLGAPVAQSSLGYYQAGYNGSWYFPLFYRFLVEPHVNFGYGNGLGNTNTLPFFDNYYAGGIQTLPGFMANTLGPKNPMNLQEGIGGNVQTLGGLNFILPDFISHKVRTAVILDAGNIFETNHVPGITYESISPNNLRVTTGIMVSWWSPLGAPLDFSIAFPLNQKPGDQLQWFGFSFGAAI